MSSHASCQQITSFLKQWISGLLAFGLCQASLADCIGIGCSCSVEAVPMNFGTYNPISAQSVDTTGTVSVTCSALVAGLNVSYDILLNQGNGGSFNPRSLSNGGDNLNYQLYTNSTRTTIWGDGTSGTQVVSDGYLLNLFSEERDYTVYGRIPGSQNVSTGSYNDTITVTVEY